MDCSAPGFPALHYLLEFAQTHVHWVGDAIQPILQSSHSFCTHFWLHTGRDGHVSWTWILPACSSLKTWFGWVERIMLYNFGIGRKESEMAQSCLTLCDPMGHRLPGSSIHGIFQARVLEWVAISFSRGSSWPRDRTQVSRIVGRRFTVWATRGVLGLEESLISSLAQVPQMGRVPVFLAPDSHRVEIGPIRLCTT